MKFFVFISWIFAQVISPSLEAFDPQVLCYGEKRSCYYETYDKLAKNDSQKSMICYDLCHLYLNQITSEEKNFSPIFLKESFLHQNTQDSTIQYYLATIFRPPISLSSAI